MGSVVVAQEQGQDWAAYNGDSCQVIKGIPDNSVGYIIYSPPFSSLYTYSDFAEDMGNCNGDEEFFEHFKYLIGDLYRILQPGRCMSVHCMELPTSKERDGFIGMRDFPGELIRAFQEAGFIFHSRVTIWKDPLIAATRTKALGLLHKQIQKDSAICRQGIADYLITMRKPGENQNPIAHPKGLTHYAGSDVIDIPRNDIKYSHNVWRKYASPVWMDIRQTNTLNEKMARDKEDERHTCPLQLDVIERGITLWSNPGYIVFTPFMGIGSEVYQAVKMGRRGIGIELKPSYFECAVKNIRSAEESKNSVIDLF